ncbi:MAG TPA: fibronectin type III-like domain-contianing protein, partial [Cyclobacteriaceae bacterium]|nr:fibronectin type III-like domain-contianing protein [Cyclobacteriaceae bacterium]
RFMESEPMYPFGFGLSYTTFTYDNMKLKSSVLKKKQSTQASVVVTNTGKTEGEEVVQLYVSATASRQPDVPRYTLHGIKRVNLKPGESKTIHFEITPAMLEVVNPKGEKITELGTFKISISGSLPGLRSEALGVSKGAQGMLTVK